MDLVRHSSNGMRPHPESLSSCWDPIQCLDDGRVNSPSRETLLGDNKDPEEGKWQLYSCGGQFTRNDDCCPPFVKMDTHTRTLISCRYLPRRSQEVCSDFIFYRISVLIF